MRIGRLGSVGIVLGSVLLALVGAAGCDPAASEEPPPEIPPTAVAPAHLAAMKQAAGIADCPTSDAAVAPVEDGLPDQVVSCLGGGRDVRLAGLRGTPMLINVWGQWCAPCREEAPYLTEIATSPHRGLLLLGIDYDDPRPDYAIEFAQLSKWRYPQLADPERKLAGPLKVSAGPPQTLFVSADGAIVFRHAGPFTSSAEIRRLVHEHLGVTLR
jgi:cytochrome c biogenesis protein CcmG, thiol:disulfide interchange protein DsbE